MTIKQELKAFAKQLIEDKVFMRTYTKEFATGDEADWLAKAIFNTRIFAIRRACDMLRDVSKEPIEIEELENKLMRQELDGYRTL